MIIPTEKEKQLLGLLVTNKGSLPYEYRTANYEELCNKGYVKKIPYQSSNPVIVHTSRRNYKFDRPSALWIFSKEAEATIYTIMCHPNFMGLSDGNFGEHSTHHSPWFVPIDVIKASVSEVIDWCIDNDICVRYVECHKTYHVLDGQDAVAFKLKWT